MLMFFFVIGTSIFNLALWLGTLSVSAAGKYSLETLRKVKELLSTDLLEEGEVLIDKITDEL